MEFAFAFADDETCYVLLCDRFINTFSGAALRSKAPPIEWLAKWPATKGAEPTANSKYVRMDLGGELGRYQEAHDVFTQTGYAVEPSVPNLSHQNWADPCHTLWCLIGPSFLAVCVYHFLRLHDTTIHGGQVKTPYELCSGRKPDPSRLRTIDGCLYAKPPCPH